MYAQEKSIFSNRNFKKEIAKNWRVNKKENH
jgi:hypothetical protein